MHNLRSTSLVVAVASLLFGGAAYAVPITFSALLSGAAEDPPVASPGTGTAFVTYDSDAHTLRVQVEFSGLVGTTTVSHIHAATAVPGAGIAGVATATPTFPGFPAGVTSGTYDNTFDLTLLTSFNAAFVTNNGGTAASAETALTDAIADGKAYLNVHSSFAGGGEIRGFLTRVPDATATASLLGFALVALLASARRHGIRAA